MNIFFLPQLTFFVHLVVGDSKESNESAKGEGEDVKTIHSDSKENVQNEQSRVPKQPLKERKPSQLRSQLQVE